MGRQRADRLNSLIGAAVSELLLTRSCDPRLAKLTVTRSETSDDLKTVRLFYTVRDDVEDKAGVAKALEKAGGYVRSHLASVLKLRHTPKVVFAFDRNLEHARLISNLLGEVMPASAPPAGNDEAPAGRSGETDRPEADARGRDNDLENEDDASDDDEDDLEDDDDDDDDDFEDDDDDDDDDDDNDDDEDEE
ncbi:MAG: 30S ribosome-binding factor RbfA [Deltaproteobacteria bacterium]|jgi:ribosome-binding factor A|nr:30S ribosome-binding factor RbfA [Deltaproteobacteria bacterium]